MPLEMVVRDILFSTFGTVKSVHQSLANTVSLSKRTINTEPAVVLTRLEINLCAVQH